MPSKTMIDNNFSLAVGSSVGGWIVTGAVSFYGMLLSFDMETAIKIVPIVTPFILFGFGKWFDVWWHDRKEKREKERNERERNKETSDTDV